MLAVVFEDTLTVTLADSAGSAVRTFQTKVVLASNGSSQSFSFSADGLSSGTYTVTAVLGPAVRPVPSAAPAAGRGDPGGCPPGRLAPVRRDDLEPAVPDFLAPHVPAARPRLRPRSPHVPVGVRAPDASLPWDRGLFEAHGRRLSARGVRDPRTSAAECLLSTAPRRFRARLPRPPAGAVPPGGPGAVRRGRRRPLRRPAADGRER